MVSHPETGSDSPIGSDRDRGRDNMHPPSNTKEIQRLTRRIAALSHFVSRSSDKC